MLRAFGVKQGRRRDEAMAASSWNYSVQRIARKGWSRGKEKGRLYTQEQDRTSHENGPMFVDNYGHMHAMKW